MRLFYAVVAVCWAVLAGAGAQAQAVRTQVFTFRPRAQHRLGTWQNSATDSVRVYWGGFSGLRAVPGVAGEFYTVTDRGPNVDAPSGNKFFPLPNFAPAIIRYRAQGDSLLLLSYLPVRRPDGSATSGRPVPVGFGATGEAACSTPACAGASYAPDVFGLDSEGLELDGQGGYWLCEEYGTSVWHVAADGHLLARYSPWANDPRHAPQDVAIDSVFRRRLPNKGFEGICRTPNGKIYALLQDALANPSPAVASNSRVHRILEIDPATNATRTFFYLHDKPTANLTNDKIYIGDAAALNNNELLVLEHGGKKANTPANPGRNRKLIYKIDLRTGQALAPNAQLAAEALDSLGLVQAGYRPLAKTLVLDLLSTPYDPAIGKAEDLAVVNDSTLAVGNDNDFGVDADPSFARLVGVPTNVSQLYLFTLPRTRKLTLGTAAAAVAAAPLYPNPVAAGQPVQLPQALPYTLLDALGRAVRRGQGREVPTTGLPAGLYLLRTETDGRPAGRFVVE